MTEPTAEHPDHDSLADLDAGLLEGTPGEVYLHVHVADCTSCAYFLARVAAAREELAALPEEPIPPAVAERIDVALATEASREDAGGPVPASVVTPLQARRSRASRWLPSAGAVAAGIALLLAGGIAVGVLQGSERSASNTGLAEAPTAKGAQPQTTGRVQNYTSATLAGGVQTLLGRRAADSDAEPDNQSASGRPLTAQGDAAESAALARLRSPAHLAACVTELTGRPDIRPLAVDYALFQGQPAVVIVLPDTDSAHVQAWVVGPACTTGRADLRRYELVPRAG